MYEKLKHEIVNSVFNDGVREDLKKEFLNAIVRNLHMMVDVIDEEVGFRDIVISDPLRKNMIPISNITEFTKLYRRIYNRLSNLPSFPTISKRKSILNTLHRAIHVDIYIRHLQNGDSKLNVFVLNDDFAGNAYLQFLENGVPTFSNPQKAKNEVMKMKIVLSRYNLSPVLRDDIIKYIRYLENSLPTNIKRRRLVTRAFNSISRKDLKQWLTKVMYR
jgi:hypothetical protein